MLGFSARSIFSRGVVLRNYWDDFANFIRNLFRSKQTKTRANETKTAEEVHAGEDLSKTKHNQAEDMLLHICFEV
ncbi:hypothetical protein ANCCAN_25294 [Ancylostoma caninum]|uniref:Uncharacterized protein n=1 Tax=Ancylostoma caninum TaxID=29170 RepID=A0A368F9Y3_ANCCA|nr:hypothetical protein ANCCAN_25294 [Ancylostoma caninum]